ncbi:ATP-binding cassette domain-containing protein [Aestuariibacter sp. AA17]|uniref:ATP-binding cassette domain-containing protein n=1 Tax=Fluctibacter corallii TaxID=2984329 RepID=A0ABT3A3G1_9ALTE|nr:ATP-binding cassette domain-containing protein [Aestuariibacter sp. AA17]MCV2883160.1 ATP-binding cassette domain-containing protein [Aestuariibacter sp. AA17]
MSPLLSVEDVSFTHIVENGWFQRPRKFVLSPVTFELNAGETMAIIGENGSGKSILAKLLVGAETPTSGAIYLNGQKLKYNNIKQRCLNIRMVFQHSNESLNPGITLGTILDEPLKLNTQLSPEERQEKVEQTLRLVGMLPEHQYFYRHMLSDGQKQRIAIARALILNPQIIVADEPFAALDPSVRSQTVNLIMKLQRDLGLGFIFISHNLGIVRHISDRILVMQEGNVVESGKTDVIFNWPKSEYTEKLVQSHQAMLSKN